MVLGRLDIRIPQHFENHLDGYVVSKCHCGGEGVLRHMECQLFGDTAQVGNLFQATIHLLVAQYRKHDSLG